MKKIAMPSCAYSFHSISEVNVFYEDLYSKHKCAHDVHFIIRMTKAWKLCALDDMGIFFAQLITHTSVMVMLK